MNLIEQGIYSILFKYVPQKSYGGCWEFFAKRLNSLSHYSYTNIVQSYQQNEFYFVYPCLLVNENGVYYPWTQKKLRKRKPKWKCISIWNSIKIILLPFLTTNLYGISIFINLQKKRFFFREILFSFVWESKTISER